MKKMISKQEAQDMLIGSLFLGCGGGGSDQIGQDLIDRSIPIGVEMCPLSEIGQDELLVTISPVGSPASKESCCGEETYTRIIELLKKKLSDNPEILPQGEIAGVIPCEIGAYSSFGPFLTAAKLGIPVVDAACDGRAHPLGTMGSLGLTGTVVQIGCGGDPKKGMYTEIEVIAAVDKAADLIRTASAAAGGLMEVARNPVKKDHLETTSALGAYEYARKIGEAYNSGKTVEDRIQRACAVMRGTIYKQGKVEGLHLETKNALDYGYFIVRISDEEAYRLTFCNEYMAMDDSAGVRVCTFPDAMITVDAKTGNPVTTAFIEEGMDVILITSTHDNMLLGEGVKQRAPYERLEGALGIEMIRYIKDILKD